MIMARLDIGWTAGKSNQRPASAVGWQNNNNNLPTSQELNQCVAYPAGGARALSIAWGKGRYGSSCLRHWLVVDTVGRREVLLTSPICTSASRRFLELLVLDLPRHATPRFTRPVTGLTSVQVERGTVSLSKRIF